MDSTKEETTKVQKVYEPLRDTGKNNQALAETGQYLGLLDLLLFDTFPKFPLKHEGLQPAFHFLH